MASGFLTNLTQSFQTPAEITITLRDAATLPQTMGWNEAGEAEVQYLFTANDLIAGECTVKKLLKSKVDHTGIKVELIGQIELGGEKGHPYEFVSLVRDLEGVGELADSKTYPFEFANVDKTFETYHGNNVRLRYFLRVKISRQFVSIQKVLDFQVQNIGVEPDSNTSIKMEVGIEVSQETNTRTNGWSTRLTTY